jgi:CRP-like cAMP-binding protein
VSSVGVKVITVEFAGLHRILKSGSPLYRKYLDRKAVQDRVNKDLTTHTDHSNSTEKMLEDALKDLNILELLNCNSALRKLTAVQKRHLESLAEGPIVFQPGERLWRAGTPVDKAFIIVSGTASFAPKRRNAGSAVVASSGNKVRDCDKDNKLGDPQIGEAMQADAIKAMKELGVVPSHEHGRGGDDEWSVSSAEDGEARHRRPSQIQFPVSGGGGAIGGGGGAIGGGGGMLGCAVTDRRGSGYSQEYDRLSRGLQKRADYLQKEGSVTSENMSIEDPEDLDSCETETESMLDFTFTDDADPVSRSRRASVIRRRSSRARFANKVLGRLYSRRAFTGGLVFSRGHFLGDVSKMVAGLLSSEGQTEVHGDDGAPSYGFGDHREGLPPASDRLFDSVVSDMVIHEQEEDHYIMHNSTLTAGKDGCVVLVFPKSSLIPFMDEYPGLLLSLLGTQVVV